MNKQKFAKFESEILDIVELSNNVKHFKISVPKDFEFIPGQYVSIIMDDKSKDRKLRRPYSIVSTNKEAKKEYIELCIKILENGNITPLIDKLKVGDKLECLGPLGEFKINDQSKNKNIILISTGVGIAPFMSMIPDILEKTDKKIILITGYKSEKDALYKKNIKRLEEKYNNFSNYVILSESQGRVQSLIEKHFDKDADYYICGLKDMISSVNMLLLKKGIQGKNIYLEKYD